MANKEQINELIRKVDLLMGQQTTLSRDVEDLSRTIRGHDEEPGLAAKVMLLLDEQKKSDASVVGDENRRKDNLLTGRWWLDKIITIVIACLVWFMFTVLPELISILVGVDRIYD